MKTDDPISLADQPNVKTFAEDWKATEEAMARAKKGDLYFVRQGDAVKIGHTTDIVKRMSHIQVSTHQGVDCLLLLRGRGHEESLWHDDFRHLRIRGEWYRLAPELEWAINDERKRQAERAA